MKIFVTGGAGYIGTTLIPMLLDKGYQVKVYDSLLFNNGDKLLPFISNTNFTFVKGDIRDENLLSKHIKGYDVVMI
jgi:nucleoside-diphosphate-sugar epimerase